MPSALPRPRRAVALAACVSLVAGVMVDVPADAQQDAWIPPVDGPIVRHFVEPIATYAAGHRGVDFAAASGTPVRAANDGIVSFSGDVAGALHVVVAHEGGIRTSYSFLASATVRRGQPVRLGQVLGRAGGSGEGHGAGVLHFGVRVGNRYVDPMLLFQPRDLTLMVRLIPADERVAAGEPDPAAERAALAQIVVDEHDDGCAGVVGVVASFFGIGDVVETACDALEVAVDAAWRELRALGDDIAALVERIEPVVSAVIDRMREVGEGIGEAAVAVAGTVADAVVEVVEKLVELGRHVYERLTSCPQPAPKKHPKGSGNLVMAVGGLGSMRRRRADGSITPSFHFEASVLGYRNDDVSFFSYQADAAVYTAPETTGDLRESARLLARQLVELGRAHPGRGVDLVAHSQGGVVVDLFLTEWYGGHEHEYPPIANVVTFASPHQGTPLADLERSVQESVLGPVARAATDAPLGAPALRQLQEGSATIAAINAHPITRRIRFLSLAGSEDPVVPSSSADPPIGQKLVVQAGAAFAPDDHGAILRDDDALSAAQAHLSGAAPADSCGPLVDVQGEVLSVGARGAAAAIDAMTRAEPALPERAPS